ASGFAAYLVKPVRQSHLFDVLASVWAGRDSPAAALVTADTISRTRPRAASSAAAPGPRFTGTRTLLAEDNPTNQKIGALMLEKLGCRVDVVANGREAVDAMAAAPYDVVFMDCQMPEMDGYEATGEIRRRELARGSRVPIIAMTANAMQGDREQCLAAGMDGYISKPGQPAAPNWAGASGCARASCPLRGRSVSSGSSRPSSPARAENSRHDSVMGAHEPAVR